MFLLMALTQCTERLKNLVHFPASPGVFVKYGISQLYKRL